MLRLQVGPRAWRPCKEHGTDGMLPCAWPGCSSGITESKFEQDLFVETSEATIFTRREWTSPLGGTYFTWDGSHLPNLFSTRQTFWNEARRNGLVATRHPEVVYHYTTLEGMMGIVQSGSIWLSDYAYLNDRRELTYGTELLKEKVQQLIASESDSGLLSVLQTWDSNLESLQNRVCITSFSADRDSLSQWRAYGPVAIGFPVSRLGLHVNQADLQRVDYDRDSQQKLIQIYLAHLCSAYRVDVAENRLEGMSDAYHRVEGLVELLVFFKDPAFQSENEYRLAYVDNPYLVERTGLVRTAKSFRVARGRVVPYVSSLDILPFGGRSKGKDFPLEFSEVILGPGSDDILERGIREFLEFHGHRIDVCHSEVPFRP
jgi:hypothetical protein